MSPEEDRTRDTVDSEPKHYHLSYSGPVWHLISSYSVVQPFIMKEGKRPQYPQWQAQENATYNRQNFKSPNETLTCAPALVTDYENGLSIPYFRGAKSCLITTEGGFRSSHQPEDLAQFVCLLVGCLMSQQHTSVSQWQIFTDNFMCCHTEIEAVDHTSYLTQSQYTDTGLTSLNADPIAPGTWQGSHWSANVFKSLVWLDPEESRCRRDSNPGSSAAEADALATRPLRRSFSTVIISNTRSCRS